MATASGVRGTGLVPLPPEGWVTPMLFITPVARRIVLRLTPNWSARVLMGGRRCPMGSSPKAI